MRRVLAWIRHNAAALVMLVLCATLWGTARAAASFEPDDSGVDAMLRGIEDASARFVKPGDTLVVSTRNARLLSHLDGLGASLRELDPSPAGDAEQVLSELLNERCFDDMAQTGTAYWLMTPGSDMSAHALAPAARQLNFMFNFEVVLPYEGDAAHAMDNFLRLVPKPRMIDDYCELRRLVPEGNAIAIISPDQFASWIGSATTGPITWLASSPQRTLRESDLAAINMPPLMDLDAYWLQVSWSPSWSFPHQDGLAYDRVTAAARAQGSPLLLSRDASLGETAASYLRECGLAESRLQSPRFMELCLK